jgi:hypothetical protein
MFYEVYNLIVNSDIHLEPLFQSTNETNYQINISKGNIKYPKNINNNYDFKYNVINPITHEPITAIFIKGNNVFFHYLVNDIVISLNTHTFKIEYWTNDKIDLVPLFLSSKIIPFILNLKGYHLFHSSCISINNKAIAFCAPHGGGKSTIASSLCNYKHAKLVSDDILPVFFDKNIFKVLPASSHVCLWNPIEYNNDFNNYPNIINSVKKKVIHYSNINDVIDLKMFCFIKIIHNSLKEVILPLKRELAKNMLLYQYYETGYSIYKNKELACADFVQNLSSQIPSFILFVDEPLGKIDRWCNKIYNFFT